MKINCLDHGFVRLVDKMGSDQRVVDAARVSYGEGTKTIQDNRNLIRYLVKNKHTTPLEKVVFEFHVKLPIFVARQWMRHRAGCFNEVSARYSVVKDEFFIPEKVRAQSKVNRQGSDSSEITMIALGGPASGNPKTIFETHPEADHESYMLLVNGGVSRELARTILPVSMYTEFYWTVNLHNLFHFLKLRLDPHAQEEIRVYAEAILSILKEQHELNASIEAFQDYVLDDPGLSKWDLDIIVQLLHNSPPQGAPPSVLKEKLRTDCLNWIRLHSKMSEREKKETRLLKLLELE